MKTWPIILAFAFLASCDPAPNQITLDNPSDKVVSVKFEQMEEITLQPKEIKRVNFVHKTEKLTVNNGAPVKIKFDSKKEYFINPTKAEYYILKIPYVLNRRGEKAYKDQYGDQYTDFGDFRVPGDFKALSKSLVIEKQWDYEVDEDARPKVKFVSEPDAGYYFVKKIIRKDEILSNMLKEAFENFDKDLKNKDDKKLGGNE